MGKVKLVSYTKSAEDLDEQGVETLQDLVAYCAKVSNPSSQINKKTSEKLIKYLIKHAHWSPLEMVDVTMEIETTRDIAHQMVRHRSFSFQEFSQRYAEPKEMGEMFVKRECRLQDTTNRQNSIEIETDPSLVQNISHQELIAEWNRRQSGVIETARKAYEWAIESGIAKEQARVLLPEGLTKTRLYMKGSMRSWLHYIELRSANGTQKEHMTIAKECAEIVSEIFPMIWTIKGIEK